MVVLALLDVKSSVTRSNRRDIREVTGAPESTQARARTSWHNKELMTRTGRPNKLLDFTVSYSTVHRFLNYITMRYETAVRQHARQQGHHMPDFPEKISFITKDRIILTQTVKIDLECNKDSKFRNIM